MTTIQKQEQSNRVIEKVALVTGHLVEDLEMDMFLEADLGLDSIKMVTLMNELMTLLPEEEMGAFEEKHPFDTLLMIETVEDLVQVFKREDSEEELLITDVVHVESPLTVANAQYPFFISQQAVSTLAICSGITVSGNLDVGRLWSSWFALIKRYPPLQAVFQFKEQRGSFKDIEMTCISNCSPPDLTVEDIQHLNETEKEQWINELYEMNLNETYDLSMWPLHGLRVIQTDQQVFKLILNSVHLISDGLSNQKFLRELLEIYDEHEAGVFFENEEKLVLIDEYNTTVTALNSWQNSAELDALKSFVAKQGRKKYLFNPLEQLDGSKYVSETSHISTSILKKKLNQSLSHLLMSQAKSLKSSLFELVLTTYLQTIHQLSSEKGDIAINIPTGGKTYPHVDASKLFGTFAQNITLLFQEEMLTNSLATSLTYVKEELNHALVNGVDRAQSTLAATMARDEMKLENGQLPERTSAFVRSSLKSNLYLSFVGETNFEERYGDLVIQDYEAYTCTNPAAIDVVVEKCNGELVLTANYDSGFFSESYVEQHMALFLEKLKEVALLSLEEQHTIDLIEQKHSLPLHTEVIAPIVGVIEEMLSIRLDFSDFHKDLEFEFGLDSLQRIRMIMKLNQLFPLVERKELFQTRTINEIAKVVSGEKSTKSKSTVPFHLIIEQSKEMPSAIGLSHHEQLFTYQHINDRSNQLAHYLFRVLSISKGDVVGVMVEPGINMVVGMLAVVKTGAAYVPIDSSYPTSRINQMIEQAGVNVVVTEKANHQQNLGSEQETKLVYIDDTIYDFPTEELNIEVDGQDLMAVIFTSGSTGKPKGVMLTHEGFMNRIAWHQSNFQLQPGERVAQKTSCCFDVSVWELFWPLMYGGTVCTVEREVVKNPWALAGWIEKENIRVLHFVPSMFGEFINAIQGESYQFNQLRWLIFSGEALPLSVVKKWKDTYGGRIGLANLYGPTEASIDVTCHVIPEVYENGEVSVPIGKPIDGVSIYLLDQQLNKVAPGEMGEVFIGGVQVANGYINDQKRSSERFISSPFDNSSVLYRTGDLGVWREDGQIDYHGRVDSQVKVRGYRIELGEIEAHLNGLLGIKEAAVLKNEDSSGHAKLIAYMVGDKQEHSKMVSALKETLPDYMIPHHFVWRSKLPKTINGKLDRANLETNVSYQLPLMPAQKWLLNYFDFPYAWTGYTQFVYKRNLDIPVFNKVLHQLTEQNEALRTIFIKNGGEWKQQILDESIDVTCDYFDLTGSTDDYVKQIMSERIEETIEKLNVHQWPLWKVVVIKNEERRYHIAFIGHHMISDVITNQVLFQEMWTTYGQLLSGIAPSDKKSTYKEFLSYMDEMKTANQKEYVAFWEKKLHFAHMSGMFQLQQDHFGVNDEGSSHKIQFSLSKEKTKQLIGNVKNTYQVKMYPLLVAPLYQMLKEVTGQNHVTVSHRMHGRDFGKGKTFMNTAGNFAVNFPLPVQMNGKASWEERIIQIKDELEQLPLAGVSYDLVSEQLPQLYYPDNQLTGIRANYLGNRDVRSLSIFEMDPSQVDQRYSSSTQKRTCLLEFFFFVEEGELKLEIEYSKNLYNEASINRYGNAYLSKIEAMINETINAGKETPSFVQTGMKEMQDKVVLITGGGTGIGKAISIGLTAAGAQTIIASRNQSHLHSTLKELKAYGGDPAVFDLDVTNIDDAKQLVESIMQRYGKLDVLINNAGITKMGMMEEIPHKDWLNIIQVNLIGTYNMCYAALPHLKKQGFGKIINLGSDSSLIGYPLMTAYAASKHGILGLTRSLAEEVKSAGITVNAICPAFVDTEMTPSAMRKNAIPTTQVADVVSFLASDRSNGITGEELKVYGKQDMHWFGSKQIPMVQAMLSRKE